MTGNSAGAGHSMRVVMPYFYVIRHRSKGGNVATRPQLGFVERQVPIISPSALSVAARWRQDKLLYGRRGVSPPRRSLMGLTLGTFQGHLYAPATNMSGSRMLTRQDLPNTSHARTAYTGQIQSLYDGIVHDGAGEPLKRSVIRSEYFDGPFNNYIPKRRSLAEPRDGEVLDSTEAQDRQLVEVLMDSLLVVGDVVCQRVSHPHILIEHGVDVEGDPVWKAVIGFSKDGGGTFVGDRPANSQYRIALARQSMLDDFPEPIGNREFAEMKILDEAALAFDGRSEFMARNIERVTDDSGPMLSLFDPQTMEAWLTLREACQAYRQAGTAIPEDILDHVDALKRGHSVHWVAEAELKFGARFFAGTGGEGVHRPGSSPSV